VLADYCWLVGGEGRGGGCRRRMVKRERRELEEGGGMK